MPATAKSRTTKAKPTDPHPGRLERLQRLIADADSLLITNATDVAYLTGFLGGDSYLFLPRSGRPTIISDFRYQEELEPVKSVAEVYIRRQAMTAAVLDVVSSRNSSCMAFQAEHLPFAEVEAIKRQLTGTLLATSGLVGQLRSKKDDAEIALIRQAIKIQQEAMCAVLPTLEPGQTELEVAARIEAEMKTRGSREPGFQTIVAAKANGSLPHYRPGKDKLAKNKAVLIDWGAVYKGYHGDMTRVFCLGAWPKKLKEIYGIVLEAHLAAASALAPGKSTHEIDAIARAHIAGAGYGEFFGHGLGHGMGLNGHEDPRLNPMYASTVLQPGNVVTIEPGIYLPGVGGVRIEDDFLVTENGAKNLCSMPKDLKWATL